MLLIWCLSKPLTSLFEKLPSFNSHGSLLQFSSSFLGRGDPLHDMTVAHRAD